MISRNFRDIDFTKKSVELDVMQNFTHKLDGIVIIGALMSFIQTT